MLIFVRLLLGINVASGATTVPLEKFSYAKAKFFCCFKTTRQHKPIYCKQYLYWHKLDLAISVTKK